MRSASRRAPGALLRLPVSRPLSRSARLDSLFTIGAWSVELPVPCLRGSYVCLRTVFRYLILVRPSVQRLQTRRVMRAVLALLPVLALAACGTRDAATSPDSMR